MRRAGLIMLGSIMLGIASLAVLMSVAHALTQGGLMADAQGTAAHTSALDVVLLVLGLLGMLGAVALFAFGIYVLLRGRAVFTRTQI